MQISVKILNELFGVNKHKYKIDEKSTETDYETTNTDKFYRHPDMPESIFMKEYWQEDSYGEDRLVKIEFVEGKEKTITVYEPI